MIEPFMVSEPIWDERPPDWEHYRNRIRLPKSRAIERLLPDFLIVSPARTGTTWLAENLAQHPQLFLPKKKELHYFDAGWMSHDLEWYLEQFRPGSSRIKGEASPSYALLPRFAIRHIRKISPATKLIFLLRHPVHRAWSNTKHSYMYREFEFTDYPPHAPLAESDAIRFLISDYTICSNDYVEILDRWSETFPRDQIHVDLLDSVEFEPDLVLNRVFKFLGVAQSRGNKTSLSKSKINISGMSVKPSENVQRVLECLHRARLPQLCRDLKVKYGIEVPWNRHEQATNGKEQFCWLKRCTDGNNVYLYRGAFLLTKQDLLGATRDGIGFKGPRNLRNATVFQYYSDIFTPQQTRNLKKIDGKVSDLRLSSILNSLPRRFFRFAASEDDSGAGTLVGNYNAYNLVLFRDRYYGLNTSLGDIDLRNQLALQPTTNVLPEHYGSDRVLVAGDLEELKARIDLQMLWKTVDELKAEVELVRSGPTGSPAPPYLVGNHAGYNIVQFRNHVYGIRQSLGVVDVTVGDDVLQTKYGTDSVPIAGSLEELKARIDLQMLCKRVDELKAEVELVRYGPTGYPATPCLAGNHAGYNLVRFQDSAYGIRQSLGPVDVTVGDDILRTKYGEIDVVISRSLDAVITRIDIQNIFSQMESISQRISQFKTP